MFFFENGGQTLWEDLFHASNGKAQASTQGSLLCSLFKFWGRVWGFGGGEDFFLIFSDSQCVPTMFSLSCHHVPQVPNVFLNMFSLAPHFYPIYML